MQGLTRVASVLQKIAQALEKIAQIMKKIAEILKAVKDILKALKELKKGASLVEKGIITGATAIIRMPITAAANPVLDLALFRSRPFLAATTGALTIEDPADDGDNAKPTHTICG